MICPRCKSNSYVNFYHTEIKCTACGHTGYTVPQDILDEFNDRYGKETKYVKRGVKKYHT